MKDTDFEVPVFAKHAKMATGLESPSNPTLCYAKEWGTHCLVKDRKTKQRKGGPPAHGCYFRSGTLVWYTESFGQKLKFERFERSSMAARRKDEPQSNGNGKGKIKFRYMDSERVVDFSVENMAGDSVTDGLHSIANALAGRTLPRGGAPTPPKRTLAGTTVDVEPEIETPEQEEKLEQEEVETAGDEEEAGDAPAKPKKVPKPKAPKLLATPVLSEAKVPLADFMAQKGPTEMMDKYAVVAVWYKEQFQITEMNIDRIFTAFKHLGQESQLPTEIIKPLSNLAYNRKWFDKNKTPGNFTINWVGEDNVGKMKPGATKA